MGTEKQGSKRGKNIGGFLQLFDWNAKSRKKLFSSKSDFPEKSKQKKRCDGNLPMTRLQMLDDDEYMAGSSIKGSSDYSCASSVNDEDFHGTKAPGVVARLMGLDSLPRSNSCEPNSTPLFDCRSLPGSCYQSENLEYLRDSKSTHSSSLQNVPLRNDAEPKYQKIIHRPLEKFQTEILPPKSAKAIPVTRNRLLSPIKSATVIRPENAAQIMEAAARIIDPGPPASTKTKLPLAGSSSLPLKVRDFKEKVQATQKPSKNSEGSQRSGESGAVKQLRGQYLSKSMNSPGDATALRIFRDSEESSSGVKRNRKSISLALQAKANVQKREGLNFNGSQALVSLKQSSEISPNQPLKSQSMAQKSMPKKPSAQNSSVVLRQNNQKQNSNVDQEKPMSKSKLQGGKVLSVDSSSARQRNSSKFVGSSKVISQKLESDVKDDKRQLLPSSSERVTCKKRSIDGNCHSEKNRAADSIRKDRNGKVIHSRDSKDMPSSWVPEKGRAGTDVISFTFTAPITRSGPGSARYNEAGENFKIFSADSRNKTILWNLDGMSDALFPILGNNVEGKDRLSNLLEQKLKELALTVEFSKQKPENSSDGMLPGLDVLMSSTMQEESKSEGVICADSLEDQQGSSLYSLSDSRGFISGHTCEYLVEEIDIHGRHVQGGKKFLDRQLPGPVSVLEHSPFASSCSSSDTADSNNTRGSKQCSSIQCQDALTDYSINKFIPFEKDAELSDSASSTSAGTEAKKQETVLTLQNGSPGWELEYVKEILHDIELRYRNYTSGKASEIMSPYLFEQLESRKGHLNGCELVAQVNRRLMFDCVSECMELRCRQYAGGGYKLWARGVKVVKRTDKLAQDVYKEICAWNAMGDFMVDELVDSDMSSQYGRWLDFEVETFELGVQIESRILNSLIDEVVADILVL